ncbi:MAG TPA: Fe-S-containing protein [Thermoanaerobaculia bacterium]
MRRFKPVHGVLIVLAVLGVIWGAEVALEGRLNSSGFQKVSPDRGQVRINVADLKPQEVRFFQFLNAGNQEVHFFVGRDRGGQLQVAFDANEQCAKFKRGYRHEGEWMVCNKCDKAFRLTGINSGGEGCSPIPVQHQVAGSELVLAESDILRGWRLFH